MLVIRRSLPHEAEELHRIQLASFQEELMAYQDYETNPACETLDRMLSKIETYDYYTIAYDGEIIGGAAVRTTAVDEFRLSPMYLKGEFQNKGLGTQILNYLFAHYPEARKWSLDTPKPNIRNRHFYEKLGFVQAGERFINERLTLIEYRRQQNADMEHLSGHPEQ